MKISCVMPTRNRQSFLRGVVKCFFDQDYAGEMELVVLDDSDTNAPLDFTPPDVWPENRRVTWIWQKPGMTTGEKRNAANALSTGDVIVHWDDDDWSHPSRVRTQLAFLQESGKLLSGYHSYLYYRMKDGAGFQYNQPDFRPHVGGSSMCYWRKAWDKVKFTDRVVGEDFIFTVQVGRENIASQAGGRMLVARAHDANTCHPSFGSRNFPAVPIDQFPPEFLLTVK